MISFSFLSCHQFTTELKIPKEHHKTILGKQGSRLKNIELATATKIHMPRADEPSDSIRISGTKEGVDKAKHQLQIIPDEQVWGQRTGKYMYCMCMHIYFYLEN